MSWSRFPATIAWIIATALAWPPAAHAQQQYTFTRISDTNNDPGIAGACCVGLNDLGTVVVAFAPSGSVTLELWGRRGDAFTQLAPNIGSVCPSLNDLDETAYIVPDPQTGHITLVRNASGAITTLASSISAPYLFNTYLPSLNNLGSAVFKSFNQGDAGIYIAPSGTRVVSNSTDPQFGFFEPGTMNDSGVVAFVASRFDATAPGGARLGIYKGSTTPLIEAGAELHGGILGLLGRPVINNAGLVAFLGTTDGSPAVYTTGDGQAVDIVGTGALDRLAINDAGTVAFRKGLGNNGDGIYVGRPGAIDQKVIAPGDALDGSSFVGGFLWEEAINASGQVAFYAFLADGRRGVYLASPVDETPPVVTPPAPLTVQATEPSGTTPNASAPLTQYLAAGSATDNVDPSPVRLAPQVAGNDVTGTTPFSVGTTTVTFRFEDASGNIGAADSIVTVTAQPSPCAVDATAAASITVGSARLNRKTRLYSQRVTIRGTSTSPTAGPVSLALDALSSGVTLIGPAGSTACSTPMGSPYIDVPVGPDNVLSRGERVILELAFQNPQGSAIAFTPRLLAGPGTR